MANLNKKNIEDIVDLASLQEGILFHYLKDVSKNLYFVQLSLEIQGAVKSDYFQEAWNKVIENNEMLRTVYRWEKLNKPVQVILKEKNVDIRYYDLSKEEKTLETEYQKIKLKDNEERFDLREVAFRLTLCKLANDKYNLLISNHHIIYDGWSNGIILKEFLNYYNDLVIGSSLKANKKTSFKNFLKLNRKPSIEGESFWKDYLKGFEPKNVFSYKSFKSLPGSSNNQSHKFYISEDKFSKLKQVCKSQKLTIADILYGAWGILLSKYSGETDMLFGTTISGRNIKFEGIERMVGLFINTIPIRLRIIPDKPLISVLKENAKQTLERGRFENVPLQNILDSSGFKENDLIESIFVVENYPLDKENLQQQNELAFKSFTIKETTNYKLTVSALISEEIEISFNYINAYFEKELIENIEKHYIRIIDWIIDDNKSAIQSLDFLSDIEKHQLLYEFNDTQEIYSHNKCIHELFEEQVERTPKSDALIIGDRRISYQKFNTMSNQVAIKLVELGVSSECIVSLQIDRSVEMMVGIMGILKAGGAYLPIDTEAPEKRVNYILNDSNSKVLLLQKHKNQENNYNLPVVVIDLDQTAKKEFLNLEYTTKSQNLSYVIYTSGSTGEPKGVMIEHHSVINRLKWMQNSYPIGSNDILIQKTPYTFDVSVWELFWWSFEGSTLFLLEKGGEKDPSLIVERISENKVSIIHFVPSMLDVFLEYLIEHKQHSALDSLRYIFASGEELKVNHVEKFNKVFGTGSHCLLINLYGPTEATVDVTYFNCNREDQYTSIPIGKPIANTQVYILNKTNRQLQAIGVVGELCLSGVGLSRGYLGMEDLTSEKFIDHPFKEGERLYRTGDLARWLPDGNIDFLGRIDNQVKIRGFRIELGEIESTILQHENVKESVVKACEENGDKYLCAYVVTEEEFKQEEISTYLTANLPDYMIPSYFVELDKIPLTANGKLNRKALPLPEVKAGNDYIAPSTETEEKLVEILSEVLNIAKEEISIVANFFKIGGNSIKSIQISSRLHNLGYKISVQEIFSNPTIKGMADVCDNFSDSSQYKLLDEIDLSPIQNRYFTNNEGLNQFNQVKILEFPNFISKDLLEVIFIEIINYYNSLRISIDNSEKGGRVQRLTDKITRFNIIEKRIAKTEAFNEELKELEKELKNRININNDPIQVVLLHSDVYSYILIGVHYLLIDEYSWEILFSSISDLYSKSLKNNKLVLSSKYESSNSWFLDFENYKGSDKFKETKKYWDKYFNKHKNYYASARGDKKDIKAESGFLSITIDEQQTIALHKKTNLYFNTKTSEILLSALLLRFKNELNWDKIAIDVESDGRQELYFDKICNEVGRFSSIYPQIINLGTSEEELGEFIKNIKESLNTVPNRGFDYLAYKYLNSSELLNYEITDTIPFISYKHLRLNKKDRHNYHYKVLNERSYVNTIPEKNLKYLIEIISYYEDDKLKIDLFFDKREIPKEFINKLEYGLKTELDNLTKYCIALNKQEKTPSDYTYKKLSFVELKKLNDKYDILDIYPLSPLQEGMYYHYLLNPKTLSFLPQLRFRLKGNLKVDILRESLNELLSHYDILRTIFVHKELDQPLQIVLNEKEMPFTFKDIRLECKNSDKVGVLNKYKESDRNKLFDLSKDILIRITVLQIEENEYEFIHTHHHILIDGWCLNILINKFFELYYKNAGLNIESTSTAGQYVNYINWLAGKNKERTKSYWQEYLKGYNNLSTIPFEKNESNGSFKFEIINLDLNQIIVEKCELLAQSYGITTSAIFSGIWGLMLSFYNNISDVVFGFVVSGRSSEISGVENMLGLFMNTIPVRIKYDENKCFKDLLVDIHNNIGKGEAHHFYSLADIKNNLNLKRDLLDHYMVYQNIPISEHDYADSKNDSNSLKISDIRNNAHTNYDFGINIIPGKETKIEFKFNSAVYNSDDIKIISNHFNKLFYNTISESSNTISEIKENLESEFSADFKRYRKTEEIDFVNKTIVNSNRSSSERESLDSWDELS